MDRERQSRKYCVSATRITWWNYLLSVWCNLIVDRSICFKCLPTSANFLHFQFHDWVTNKKDRKWYRSNPEKALMVWFWTWGRSRWRMEGTDESTDLWRPIQLRSIFPTDHNTYFMQEIYFTELVHGLVGWVSEHHRLPPDFCETIFNSHLLLGRGQRVSIR